MRKEIAFFIVVLLAAVIGGAEPEAKTPINLAVPVMRVRNPVTIKFLPLPLLVDGKRHRVAVLDIEDKTKTLSENTLAAAREYLRGEIVASDKLSLILKDPKDKAAVKKEKQDTWKEDYDTEQRIQPGEAIPADTALLSSISVFGSVHVFALELVDLAKEAAITGAKAEYDGTEEGLRLAIKQAAAELSRKAIKNTKPRPKQKPEPMHSLPLR